MRITQRTLDTLVHAINTSMDVTPAIIRKPGRKFIVVSAEGRTGGYWVRETGGDLGTSESNVFHGSAREVQAYLTGVWNTVRMVKITKTPKPRKAKGE